MRVATARPLWYTATALVFANLLLLVFLVLPARDGRGSQDDRLLELQRRVRNVQRDGQSGDAVVMGLKEVDEFTAGFPARAELLDVKTRLTRLADTLAVDIPTVDYRPSEVKEAGLIKVTMTMTVEGPYAKIRRYLYELEGMRRHLVIERVGLRDPKGLSDLQLQLQLALYLRAS